MRNSEKARRTAKQIIVLLFAFAMVVMSSSMCKAQDDLDVLAYGINRNGKVPQPEGNFTKLTIPLKRAQNLLMIEARINGIEGNFILDTGAPHLVLNKTYFRQGKLADGTTASGVTGGSAPVYHLAVDSLIIDDLFYVDLDADLVNLGHLEDAKGVKILGLLGANLFSQMQMDIDVQNNTLTLTRSAGNEQLTASAGSSSENPDLQVPLEYVNNILFVNGIVAGKKLRFCLDTGAETNVLSNASGNKVLDQFQLMSRTDLGGSGAATLNVLSGQLNQLTIGAHNFNKMPVILADLSGLRVAYDTDIDGILGYDFLSNGRVILNFTKKELSMYFYKEEGR